eukprot:5709066-Pleurochrysis_carterae.AAC.1
MYVLPRLLNTRVRARRGLRVPPAHWGRASEAGGGRSVGPLRLVRVCVCRARRGRAKAYDSGMILHNQKHTGKPNKHANINTHASQAYVTSGRKVMWVPKHKFDAVPQYLHKTKPYQGSEG